MADYIINGHKDEIQTNNDYIIKAYHLTKKYHEGLPSMVTAIDDLTFGIETGRMIAIAGPSGSGKSTLLNILGCMDSTSTGQAYIDNIEVPNLNHLPKLGSTGGFYSALNPSLIGFLDVNTGNFSADYGDRLSSITSISLREGNRERVAGDLGMSFALTGGAVEGPLFGGKGAWLRTGTG